MLKTMYIYHRSGRVREVAIHVADSSDPPAVQDFFGRHPPAQHIDLQIDETDEIISNAPMTPHEVELAFAEKT